MGKYRELERAVMWLCRHCGAYNLHPLDEEEFQCIGCEYLYLAEGMEAEIIKWRNK